MVGARDKIIFCVGVLVIKMKMKRKKKHFCNAVRKFIKLPEINAVGFVFFVVLAVESIMEERF